jgi:hypothetical protein
MDNTIDYEKIMQSASLRAIHDVLSGVSKTGLPGNHHFYITFDTNHPDAEISKSLKERYPDEMTIVIENWYENLIVENLSFSITLNFGNVPEIMKIPFDAIKSFVDPSVEFGLSFSNKFSKKSELDINDQLDHDTTSKESQSDEITKKADRRSGEVVSLESFRKT